jgi:hypothetical protein
MTNLVDTIKEWALQHYNESFGASCIIECMTDDEIRSEFESLDDAKAYAGLQDEQYQNARCDM